MPANTCIFRTANPKHTKRKIISNKQGLGPRISKEVSLDTNYLTNSDRSPMITVNRNNRATALQQNTYDQSTTTTLIKKPHTTAHSLSRTHTLTPTTAIMIEVVRQTRVTQNYLAHTAKLSARVYFFYETEMSCC